jgi:amidase
VAVELEGEGAHVERIEPDIDFDRLWQAGGEIAGAEMAGPAPFLLRTMLRLKFRLMADRSPIRRGFIRGPGLNAAGLLRALEQRDEAVRRMDEVFDDFDAWLCPVTATPAFSHRKTGRPIEVDGQPVSYFLAAGGFASTFNVSGNWSGTFVTRRAVERRTGRRSSSRASDHTFTYHPFRRQP